MKITSVKLVGCKRLFLNNINTLVYEPKEPIQLVLGSNGSGKSSLLKVTNILPMDKSIFNDGGYGEVSAIHNNKHILAISCKEKPGKYNFFVDNVEKNPGGTKRAQLQLCEEYANLTPKKNDIVIGIKTLTDMSSLERKEWLRTISTVDYSYSIKLYTQFKNRLRDISGGIKLLTTEITKDTNLLVEAKELDLYNNHIKHINKYIESLMFDYNNSNTVKEDIQDELRRTVYKLERYDVPANNITIESVTEKIQKLNHTVTEIDSTLTTVNKNIDKIEYVENNDTDKVKLDKELAELKNELKTMDNMLKVINFDNSILSQCESDLSNIYNNITSTIQSLSEFDSVVIEPNTELDLKNKINADTLEYRTISTRVLSYESELKRLKDSLTDDNKIVCNKCGDISYFGYDKNRISFITGAIDKSKEKMSELEKTIDELNLKMIPISSKVKFLGRLKTIMSENPRLYPLWSHMVKDKTIGNLISYDMQMKLDEGKTILDYVKNYTVTTTRIDSVETTLKILEEVNKVKQTVVNNSKKDLLEQFEKLSDKKKKCLSELTELEKVKNDLMEINTHTVKLKQLLRKNRDNKDKSIIEVKNKGIKDIVGNLKGHLLEYNEKITDNERIKSKLEANKKLLKEYEAKHRIVKRVVKALSPTEGLIAKSINGFINKILQEVNIIINEVWSHEMTLLPCKITDENDLDYMFRVKVDDREIIDDVSSLSTSMKDIVNLAFRIVFMKYSKLNHMPLFLDEFGAGMDSKHRNNAFNVINNILAPNFTQVFIVAHYKSMYGKFSDAGVNVLDSRNIEINKDLEYNENLKIS